MIDPARRERIIRPGGGLLFDALTFDEAHAKARDLERRRVSYRWERWAGERAGWCSVRGASFADSPSLSVEAAVR